MTAWRAVCLCTLLVASCHRAPQPPALAPAEQVYTTRGVIDRLPSGDERQFLIVHHEAIPGFIGADGTVVGMPEHAMSFPWVGEGVSLAGLREGDAVELTFEIRWKSKPRSLVTGLRKLPERERPNLRPVVEDSRAGGGTE